MSSIIGQSLHDVHVKWYLICNGDDAIVFTDALDADKVLKYIEVGMKKTGFELGEPEFQTVFEMIKFDQCTPIQVSEECWIMVREPLRILTGLFYTSHRLEYKQYLEWLLGVASGEYALAWWLPLIGDITGNIIKELSRRGVRHVDMEKFDRGLKFRFDYQEYGKVVVNPQIVRSSSLIRYPFLSDMETLSTFLCPEFSDFGVSFDPTPTLITAKGTLII